jgi:hypothetical protein
MKKLIFLSLFLFVHSVLFAGSIEDQIQKAKSRIVNVLDASEIPSETVSPENLEYEYNLGEYSIKVYKHQKLWRYGILQIFRGEDLVFHDHNYDFHVAQEETFSRTKAGWGEQEFQEMFKDITGDGEPNLVIYTWTGGAHGIHGAYVFTLGKEFGVVSAGKGDVGWAHFEDLDEDGVLEFMAIDKNFEYWNAGYANSPFEEVILEYKDGEYKFAKRFMQKPPPTAEELDERVQHVKEEFEKELAIDGGSWYWRDGDFILSHQGPWFMLEYIYSGNIETAWEFFDRIWPEGAPGKEKYLQDFKDQLKQSNYWEEIATVYNISL